MNSESSTSGLTRQGRIAEIAKQHPQGSLNSIHHHLDLDWLRVAYGQLQNDRAPGHDGETVQAYGKDLDRRLTDLLARVRAGRYHAPPVKRARCDNPRPLLLYYAHHGEVAEWLKAALSKSVR